MGCNHFNPHIFFKWQNPQQIPQFIYLPGRFFFIRSNSHKSTNWKYPLITCSVIIHQAGQSTNWKWPQPAVQSAASSPHDMPAAAAASPLSLPSWEAREINGCHPPKKGLFFKGKAGNVPTKSNFQVIFLVIFVSFWESTKIKTVTGWGASSNYRTSFPWWLRWT